MLILCPISLPHILILLCLFLRETFQITQSFSLLRFPLARSCFIAIVLELCLFLPEHSPIWTSRIHHEARWNRPDFHLDRALVVPRREWKTQEKKKEAKNAKRKKKFTIGPRVSPPVSLYFSSFSLSPGRDQTSIPLQLRFMLVARRHLA